MEEKKVIAYFGTMGKCSGHNLYVLQGSLSSDAEDELVKTIDNEDFFKMVFEMAANGHRGQFIRVGRFVGFSVRFSPDDERDGSQTTIFVEDGDRNEVVKAIDRLENVKSRFLLVYDKYKFMPEERHDFYLANKGK